MFECVIIVAFRFTLYSRISFHCDEFSPSKFALNSANTQFNPSLHRLQINWAVIISLIAQAETFIPDRMAQS